MRREQLFHRWLLREGEDHCGAPGELLTLCQELNVDFHDLVVGRLPSYSDYEEALLGPLRAAWTEIESFSGSKEREIEMAARSASDSLVGEEEARVLLRRSWSWWTLYLQRRRG
jgi:hypothetical protein